MNGEILVANPDPHNKHPEEFTCSDYCNNFEKCERLFSCKATHLQHAKFEMEKR